MSQLNKLCRSLFPSHSVSTAPGTAGRAPKRGRARAAYLALALLLLAPACKSDPAQQQSPDLATPPGPDMGSSALLAVVGSDFTNGALETVGLGSRVVQKDLDVIDPMSVVRGFGNMLYAIDQSGGLVRQYDASQGFKNPVEFPASKAVMVKGIEANPHDIYIDAPRQLAYVSLFGAAGTLAVTASRALGIINLKDVQAGITSFVPLTAAAADTDGNPEADRLVACGDKLYVLLLDQDRNNSYVATGPGRLAVVNLAAAADPPTYIQLAGQSPSGLTILPGCTEAIVGSAADMLGGVQAGLGGIEVVDLVGKKSRGLAMTDSMLGGNVGSLDAVDAAHVFVALSVKSGSSYVYNIYSVDLDSKQKGAVVLGPMSFVPGLRVLGGRLVVLSAGTAGAGQLPVGVFIGPATGAPLTDPALDVGLPPQSVALVTP